MSLMDLNDETAVNVLILWLVGADGSICYDEAETIKRVLDDLDHDSKEYFSMVNYLSGLGNEEMEEFVVNAINFIKANFSKEKKRTVILLSEALASSDGHISHEETTQIDRIKEAFGV